MAYLDSFERRTRPLWWTGAVYKRDSWGNYRFVKYMSPVNMSWGDFVGYQMDHYPLAGGYYVYPFYWNQGAWERDSMSVSGERAAVVGKLERQNPLPVGRYWQDIFQKQATDWDNWAHEHMADDSIAVVKFEYFRADPLHSGEWLPLDLQPDNAGTIPARTWVLFDVKRPVDWPATKLGFPTVVDDPSRVQSSADTAQNPPGPTPLEEVGDAIKRATSPLLWGAGIVLGIKLISSLRK